MFAPLLAAVLIASAALSAPQEALVTQSVADLAGHQPPAIGFRDVRLTVVEDPDGTPRQLVCGEVLMEGRWSPFGSRETMSGYEHLVGSLARAWCTEPGLEWLPSEGLTARYEAEVAKR